MPLTRRQREILDYLTGGVADEAIRLFLDGEEVHADSWDYSGND